MVAVDGGSECGVTGIKGLRDWESGEESRIGWQEGAERVAVKCSHLCAGNRTVK